MFKWNTKIQKQRKTDSTLNGNANPYQNSLPKQGGTGWVSPFLASFPMGGSRVSIMLERCFHLVEA